MNRESHAIAFLPIYTSRANFPLTLFLKPAAERAYHDAGPQELHDVAVPANEAQLKFQEF